MHRNPLKLLRVAAAAVVLAGLTLALADFRTGGPWFLGHALASLQLVPSLVALLTGASLALAGVIVLLATLAFGRVYCSAICPLGILQDVIARVAGRLRRGQPPYARFARPWTRLRWTVVGATAAGIAAGGAGLTLALVDPYSNYGRLAADVFRPVLTLANNALVGPASALGLSGLYRVAPAWAGGLVLHPPLVLLALLTVLVVLRGRLYCNTLCPVGTLLGWLAKQAAFRLAIDRDACTKCAACLAVCKSQCLDLRTGAIDFSRCVACYNCIGACDRQGIGYRLAWRRAAPARPAPSAPRTAAAAVPGPDRRAFLAGAATVLTVSLGAALAPALRAETAPQAGAGPAPAGGDGSPVILPPGAGDLDRFAGRCTACHLCVSACPTHVLTPAFLEAGWAGLLKPRLDYRIAFCNYDCRRCAEVCPDGALTLLALPEKQLTQIGEAHFERDLCIVVAKGTDCAACSEHCPTKAVNTVPYGNNLRLPELHNDLCIGCGACEYACPVQPKKAIAVTGRRRHGRARKAVETKATAPVPAGDFPF